MNTIESTVCNNLCISCGICKAVCPKDCIAFHKEKGMKLPAIDKNSCIECGKCYQVCPGKGFDYTRFVNDTEEASFWFGSYRNVYTAYSLDEKRRGNSVSGGVVTELVYRLLENKEYESAFLIGTHRYLDDEAAVKRYTAGQSLDDTQKSRYLPVSQEKAVSYILSHRREKIILVGTGCFVQGIMNVIDSYKLDRKQYFIIGLFCDKTMTGNVVDYFSRHSVLKGQRMDKFFFRTKEAGGWPGGVQIISDAGRVMNLPNTERMKVKDYFQPERCLYCLDKLNMFADISVGDNYTGTNSDSKGSNSVIVRTQEGQRVWDAYASSIYCESSSKEHVVASQHLKQRALNSCYAELKGRSVKEKINVTGDLFTEPELTLKVRMKYWFKRFKIRVGTNYGRASWMLSLCLVWKNIKLKVKNVMRRSSICL